MTMLEHLSEEVLNLWNKWEIRGMVLLSLLLQIILIIFGSRRKTIARSWIRILVWSTYLSADMVATVALGTLARSQINSSGGGSTKANNSIQAFWAPFLLLHLGGPDTITAYSIEDNELWLRHLLGLAFQVSVAFYVFSRSWDINILTFIAIPMFIVGIMKYAERTWVLRSSCSKHMKDSFLSIGRLSSLKGVPEQFGAMEGSYLRGQAMEGSHLLRQAYFLFHISMFMMQDLLPGTSLLSESQRIISANSAEDAFKIVEIELGLIYDRLYTKVPQIYSCMGIILRSISFLLSLTAFATFAVMINKHAYSTIDITITYLLLVGALVLEIYAFLCLVFSDWTLIWLSTDKGGNTPASCARPAICSLIGKLTPKKRWSRSMAQHNLINSCIEDKPVKCLELFGIHEMMREMYVIREDMNVGLQAFIFGHLQKKGEMIMKNFNFIDPKIRSKIIDQRGDGVLEGMEQLEDFKWCTTEVEFSHSILVWHLATDICFYSWKRELSERETSKWLSEYMMYLLMNRPNMLPQGIGDLGYSYRQTCDHLMNTYYFGRKTYHVSQSPEIREDLVNYVQIMPKDDVESRMVPEYNKSALFHGVKLANQIQGPGRARGRGRGRSWEFMKKQWKMINEVWIEMLAYAAAHCPWKEHAQQLRRGGELLTHVSFLMLHFGLSQQYQFNSDDMEFYSKLSGEYGEKMRQALEVKRRLDVAEDKLRRQIMRKYDEEKYDKGPQSIEEALMSMALRSTGVSQSVPQFIKPRVIGHNHQFLQQNNQEIKEGHLHCGNGNASGSSPHELSQGEISEGSVECSGGQGIVHQEIEEVLEPIGANYSPLSSNIANLEVEDLKKVVPDNKRELKGKEQELEYKDWELVHKDRELDHNKIELERMERELKYKHQELEQMRSLLAASTQQQQLDAFPIGSSAQSDDQGTSNEIRLTFY